MYTILYFDPLVHLANYWCPSVRNRQIHVDLGVPLFADHISALTESFDSKLADMRKPLVRQLGRYVS